MAGSMNNEVPIIGEAQMSMEDRIRLELTAYRVAAMLLLEEKTKLSDIESDWQLRVMADHLAHLEIEGNPFDHAGITLPDAIRQAQITSLQSCERPECKLAWENWRALVIRKKPMIAIGPLTAQLLDERWGLSYAIPVVPGDAVRVWLDKKDSRLSRPIIIGADGGNA